MGVSPPPLVSGSLNCTAAGGGNSSRAFKACWCDVSWSSSKTVGGDFSRRDNIHCEQFIMQTGCLLKASDRLEKGIILNYRLQVEMLHSNITFEIF